MNIAGTVFDIGYQRQGSVRDAAAAGARSTKTAFAPRSGSAAAVARRSCRGSSFR